MNVVFILVPIVRAIVDPSIDSFFSKAIRDFIPVPCVAVLIVLEVWSWDVERFSIYYRRSATRF